MLPFYILFAPLALQQNHVFMMGFVQLYKRPMIRGKGIFKKITHANRTNSNVPVSVAIPR